MSKYGSSASWFLVDGFTLLSAKVKSVRHKITSETEPSETFGDTFREHLATGMGKAELVQEGAFFDTSAASIHAVQGAPSSSPQQTPRVVCTGNAGQTIGVPFVGFEGVLQTEYEVLASEGVLQKANAAHVVSGELEWGVILHPLSEETADADTESESVDHAAEPQRVVPITSSSIANPSVITTPVPHGLASGDTVLIAGHSGSTPDINGEQTATVVTPTTFTIPVNVTGDGTGGTFTVGKTNNGGVAFLQMTELTLDGHDGALVTIRDSADDITYGDLVAFTVRTDIGAERVEVAGAVERYLAQSLDLTGSGTSPTCSYFAGFSRNR